VTEEKFGIRTKKLMMGELKEKIGSTSNIVMTNYKGLDPIELEKLRKEFSKSSSRYLIVKNSIAKRVFSELKIEDLSQFLTGEVGIGLVGDIISASKTLVDFSREHNALKLNGAFIDGKLESTDRIKQLAALPPRDVLLAMVIGYMKGPINGFVGILRGLLRNLVYAINEIKNKKEGGEKNG